MIKKIVLALGLSLLTSQAFAVCGAIPLTIKDASNVTQNLSSASATNALTGGSAGVTTTTGVSAFGTWPDFTGATFTELATPPLVAFQVQ